LRFTDLSRFQESLNAGFDAAGPGEMLWSKFWPDTRGGFSLTDEIYIQPTDVSSPGDARYPVVIYISSGNAFGDRHPTTVLCMKYLAGILKKSSPEKRKELRLLDAGTGTGILSILAAKLGVMHIDAIDLNMPAIESAAENIELNRCGWISLTQCDLSRHNPRKGYDIICANIISEVIIQNLDRIKALMNPGGILIASGVGNSWHDDVMRGFACRLLELLDHAVLDGWHGYMLKKHAEKI